MNRVDQLTNLDSLCILCYSETEPQNAKRIVDLINLMDLKEIMKYLELDHELNSNDIVCEYCFDKLLDIDRFKRKCLTARTKFNERNRCEENISIHSDEFKINEINRIENKSNKLEIITELNLHKKSCQIKEIECNKTLMSQSGINTAIEYHEICQQNNDRQHEIQCDVCKVMCNNLETYMSHKMSHDTKISISTIDKNGKALFRKKERNSFVCDICGKLFSNSRNIRKHKLNVHLIDFDGVLFSCDLCPIKKPTKRLLYKHMKSVHILKPMACDICGKVYKTRELWQKHSLIHNDLKKNHICTYCPHKPRFLCKSALQKHLKSSHRECSIGSKYQCDFKNCEASYASEINLNKHKVKVHGYL